MARSKITLVTDDLVSDSGSVLFSFVKGEQVEFPVQLNLVQDVTIPGFEFEAVVVEAENVSGQPDKPASVKTDGVQTVLGVRIPTYLGVWSNATTYNYEDVVKHGTLYYKLISGVNYLSATSPDQDPAHWVETALNILYVQFPSSLGATYAVQPLPSSQVYGFFELRVTEPNNAVYRRTWKPVRGMVEIHFSPTDAVS